MRADEDGGGGVVLAKVGCRFGVFFIILFGTGIDDGLEGHSLSLYAEVRSK